MSNSIQFGSGVSEAVLDVKNEGSSTNWALFGYKPKTNELKVDGTGDGDLSEFVEELNDGKVLFGFVGFTINQTHKYLYVPWCGEGVDGMRKGLFGQHAQEMEKWLGQGGRGFHLQINARTTSDLKESIVLEQLNKVSSFIKASSLKKAATNFEAEKAKSAEYWNNQKQADQAHAKAAASYDTEKQNRLAASKQAETQRLQSQAQATLGAMEEQRTATSAAFKKDQDDIAQKQANAREANRQKIFSEQEQQKQSQHVQADAVHGVSSKPTVQGRVNTAAHTSTSTSTPSAPPPAAKKAPGKLAAPGAFTASASAAPPVAPKSKPAPPPPRAKAPEPEPVYEPEPEPEPAYEEPAYEEPAAVQEEPAYEEPAAEEYPAEETYTEEQSAYPQCRGLYYYAAETETDLTFNEGDIINILDDTDPDGWWKGELNGAEGFFPSNFVERL
eukprot:TRINITY_DN1331_c0_g1_i2.p1 TRINITY_DN1331_c0_g1~~TRINITY_DN1331_c0_g1_i2.p1  ORF type:complete len:444 (+),score=171.90 TRINITY_DN1331_c0_g1_i2:69-1400(+)